MTYAVSEIRSAGRPRKKRLTHGELDYVCSGINHQTWFIDLRLNGRKIGKDELIAAFEAHPVFSQQEKLRIDVLKRFGVYSTESNGHLSEYLPWYRKRPEEITRWIDMSHVIVAVTLAIPNVVLLESFLGFLGFAVKPPLISWGLMLQDTATYSVIGTYPWILSPVGFVLITVFAFNALGDGLRDAVDPYQ